MGWPQITMIVLLTISWCVGTFNHGQPRPSYNAFDTNLGTAISVFLLWAGGFWG